MGIESAIGAGLAGDLIGEGSSSSSSSRYRTWKQAPQPTPARYSAGLAAARKPALKEAASVPYPQEPPASCHAAAIRIHGG